MRVNPMSCGDFDRFMDGARKFSKYIFPLAGASLIGGCTSVEIGQILTRISERTQTNPLPSDFTKTPTLTEANYELTPTVQNPTTQELTLVSPTEVATEIPTLTLTPEPTSTKTEEPTPTKEKSLIEGNIFFDPQSKEDFKDVVLAPSPINEPEEFALWHEEYLKLINEKLENYNGPTVELTESLLNGLGNAEFYSENWPVVGSYLFNWRGEDVLNKTYIFYKKSDGAGYVLLNLTYSPGSLANPEYREDIYSTPVKVLSIRYYLPDYIQEKWPNAFYTDFFSTYVMTEDKIDSLMRVLWDKPKDGDEELFTKMQFISAYTK